MSDYREGIKVSSARVNIAAAATPTLIYTIPAGRSCVIRKLVWSELSGLAGDLHIGHGAGGTWVQDMPSIDAPANLAGNLEEKDIQNQEFFPSPAGTTTRNIYAQTTVSTNLDIQVEVEEYGA
jgi:hypothetical protein